MIVITAASGSLIGKASAAANTAYYAIVPSAAGYYTRVVSLQVDNGATNNGLYLMRPLESATVQTAQAASDTTLVLDRDPSPSGNTIASGDQVVYLASDGTYRKVQVSSWSAATLTLTVGALPAAVAAGSTMWNFGVHTDTEPDTSLPFPLINTPTSAVTTYDFGTGFAGWSAGEPLMIYCPNATNQTNLNYAEYARTLS